MAVKDREKPAVNIFSDEYRSSGTIMGDIDQNPLDKTLTEPNDGQYVNLIDLSLAVRETVIWGLHVGLLKRKSHSSESGGSADGESKQKFEDIMFSKIFAYGYIAPDNSSIYARLPDCIPLFSLRGDDKKSEIFINHLKELLVGGDITSEASLKRRLYVSLCSMDYDTAENSFYEVFKIVWDKTRKPKPDGGIEKSMPRWPLLSGPH